MTNHMGWVGWVGWWGMTHHVRFEGMEGVLREGEGSSTPVGAL